MMNNAAKLIYEVKPINEYIINTIADIKQYNKVNSEEAVI